MSAAARLFLRRRCWWRNLLLDEARGYQADAHALHVAECRTREAAATLIGYCA